MARTYDQFCPAARALDVVGGRWTLLVVRELAMGPRRYTELLDGLPGIGPNVLAERLSGMREHGLVRKTETAAHRTSVYELTDRGQALRPVVDELSAWGMRLLDEPKPGEHMKLDWLLSCLRASFRPDLARGVAETYQFRIDRESFYLSVRDGGIEARHGAVADPAFTLETDLLTFMAFGCRLVPLADALDAGIATVDGDPDAGERCVAIIGPHFEATGARYGLFGAVRGKFVPEAGRGLHEVYEFRIDGHVFHSRIDDGTIEVAPGPAEAPAAVLVSELSAFLALAARRLTVEDGVSTGRMTLSGDAAAAERMSACFDVLMG